jgi:MGT family glycosyltransferase
VTATFLAYVDAVPGRLYPLVPTLLELARRRHRVAVRCGAEEAALLRAEGLDAEPLAPEIAGFDPDDWQARTRFGALVRGLRQFGERARFQVPDLEQALRTVQPDVLLVDEGAWGAAAAAQRSGLPWAFSIVSPVPLRSRDAPPFGLGLPPRTDAMGRVRDRLVGSIALGGLERMIASHVNPVRAGLGLPPVRSLEDIFLAAPRVLAYTAEPFEYPRTDWPPQVELVGPGLWEPPVDPPAWLDDLGRPLLLVSCSTLYQNDRRLAEVACEAFAGAPFDVVVTTADVDLSGLRTAANVRVERFVPHLPLLAHASCVVCHGGMGITQKALAHGVPVVAIPFGRDQPEVARRVETAGAGVRLPARRLEPRRLRASVRRARGLRAGAQRVAAAFAAAGGPARAADVLEQLAGSDAAARPGAVSPQGATPPDVLDPALGHR